MSISQKESIQQAAEEAKKTLARRHCDDFCERVLKDEKGQDIFQADIHKEIQWHVDECKRQGFQYCGILAPWGHGKTEQIAITRTLDEIGKDPNIRIQLVSNTDGNAKDRVTSVTKYISRSDEYHSVYPEIKPAEMGEWTKHKIIVERDSHSKDGTLEAWGVLSSGAGSRSDLTIFDDIVDMRNAITNPALRGTVKENFKNVWLGRLDPKGFAIYIATIWHQDDLTSDLLKDPGWKFLVMKISDGMDSIECESPFKGKFRIKLWEEKWGKKELLARKAVLGNRAYNRGFKQEALSDEDRTFPSSEKIFNESLSAQDIVRPEWARCVGIDPFGQWVVIFILALSPDGRRIPIDIRRGKWKPKRTVTEIIEVNKVYRPQIIVCENNAAQTAIAEWAIEKGTNDLPLIPFTTGKQKADPAMGLPSLDVEFENGSWVVPLGKKHEGDCECGFCVWRQELNSHPLGKTEDIVMASWFAREGARFLLGKDKPDPGNDDIVTAEDMGVDPVQIGDY